MLLAGKVLEFKGRDDEENEIHKEPNHLHFLATVELVIDEECFAHLVNATPTRGRLTCKVVSHKRNAHVDQVVEPTRHDRGAIVGNDIDELALKQLVTVEENIIGKPSTGGGDHSRPEVGEG